MPPRSTSRRAPLPAPTGDPTGAAPVTARRRGGVLLRRLGARPRGGVWGPIGADAATNPPHLDFWQRIPAPVQAYLADDVKLLIGWTFDTAASNARFGPGQIVDRRSTFETVPGCAAPTSLKPLHGRYRIARVFDAGHGYYGIEFAALDGNDKVVAVLLLNRLLRAPIALRDPGGLLTDLITCGAMFAGLETRAVADAEAAAETALGDAAASGVVLLTGGQSQAGGVAQLQAADLWHRRAPFANCVGFQVYVHRDGSASRRPGDSTYLDAALHPRQHFLGSFNDISVSQALIAVLAER